MVEELGKLTHLERNGETINLKKIPPNMLRIMLLALKNFNKYEQLIIWSKIFLGMYLTDIKEYFNIEIHQQNALYKKYKDICNKYLEGENNEK